MRFTQTCLFVFLLAWPLHGVSREPDAAAPRAQNQLSRDQIAAGWIKLFDGETLYGWQRTSDANWHVADGEIQVSEGAEGFLMTTTEFAAFELHVEFKAPASTNSGVFFRTPLDPQDPARDCYEYNIAPPTNPFPTGSLVGRRVHKLDSEASEDAQADGPAQKPIWHTCEVLAVQGTITVTTKDQAVVSTYIYEDPSPVARGRIGLQFREGPVAFRNIRLKPLWMDSIFNGRDLTGWTADKAEAAKFEATPEGELHVKGGRGQLETDDSYGDFVLQFDCFVDGDALNSGVFFRSIPRDFANGYEAQIQNAIKDNDPTQPVDAGTGAIYRRTTARRVVSKDREWFTMTLIPTGPHIAVWVNGYQVTDWTDDRQPDPNPRRGLRTDPGTISLQAHDPTTNIRFRNLRIAEFPEATSIED